MREIKLRNFEFISSCEVLTNKGLQFDLHNTANFKFSIFDVTKKKAYLLWSFPNEWFCKEGIFQASENALAKMNLNIKDIGKTRLMGFEFTEVEDFIVTSRDDDPLDGDESDFQGVFIEQNFFNFYFHSGREITVKANEVIFHSEFKQLYELI